METPGYIWGQAHHGRPTKVHRYTARRTARSEEVTIFCPAEINTLAAGRSDHYPGGPGFIGECERCARKVATQAAKEG